MENLQGKIRRMITFIMLFVTVLCGRVWGQVPAENRVDGQVSFRIETKRMSAQVAQQHITNQDDIPLMVQLIFKGGWVTRFDANTRARLNASSFSYGIAQKSGTTAGDAPLYTNNPPAYMLAARDLNCATPTGTPLKVPAEQDDVYITGPDFEMQGCPQYGYGCGMANTSGMRPRKETIDGEVCYVLDLFQIYFKLKRLETVYVRGIDANYGTDADGSVPTTAMTTELNLRSVDNSYLTYWPGCPDPSTSADWTMAPKAYYGGIIPGGIFIEQAPEVAQFEPCD